MNKIYWLLICVFISSCNSHFKRNLNPERDLASNRPVFKPIPLLPTTQDDGTDDLSNGKRALAPLPRAGDGAARLVEPFGYAHEKIINLKQFEAIAGVSEGLIRGTAVKFLIDNRSSNAKIYFINGNYVTESGGRPEYTQYHYDFAVKHLKLKVDQNTFDQMTYFGSSEKKFIAGTLQRYEVIKEGSKESFLGVQFYPQDTIAEKNILHTVKLVKSALQFNDYPLVVVAYGAQQTTNTIASELRSLQVETKSVEQVYSGINYIAMNNGEAYGYLRLFPVGDELDLLTEKDIPVFSQLPLDLSVVSAVVSTVVQDAGAHVNLKSKERNTPNMVLRDLQEIENLKKLNSEPVKIVIRSDTYSITKSTPEAVDKFISDKYKNKKWVPIKNGDHKRVYLFDEMAKENSVSQLAELATSYGGKSAKLALLAHKDIVGMGSDLQVKYGYRLSPLGLALPVTMYFDFLNANPILKIKIETHLKKEMSVTNSVSSEERLAFVSEIQSLFYKAQIPDDLFRVVKLQMENLKKQTQIFYPASKVKKVKIRSSANAEDIPNFDGAGLHSSYGVPLEEIGDPNSECRIVKSGEGVNTKEDVEPNTVMCGIKAVFASLWNKRAIEERNFARIDQNSAAMGIAINPSYDFRKKEGIKEIANAVLVTRVINSKGVYGYRLSVNTDDNLVTNPTPNTQSEIVVATFITPEESPQFSFVQYAKPEEQQDVRKSPLLNLQVYKNMVEMARSIEQKYCYHIPNYYFGDCKWVSVDSNKSSSLDMEFKIYSNGEILVKQVREFGGK